MTTPLKDRLARAWPFLLAASVAFNLFAATCLLMQRPSQDTDARPVASNMAAAVATATGSEGVAAVTPPPSPAPFRWQQLDAPDFPTYVANLRAIHCPEETIRDIIAAELAEIYGLKMGDGQTIPSQPFETVVLEHPTTGPTTTGAKSGQEIERLLVQLLDTTPLPTDALPVAQTVPSPTATATAAITDVTDIPAAFLVGNGPGPSVVGSAELPPTVKDPNLTAETAEQLNRMRDDFAKAVADTSSPTTSYSYSSTSSSMASAGSDGDYYRRWLKAKRDSDEVFSSMYGGDALIRVQQQALFDASAQQAASQLVK